VKNLQPIKLDPRRVAPQPASLLNCRSASSVLQSQSRKMFEDERREQALSVLVLPRGYADGQKPEALPEQRRAPLRARSTTKKEGEEGRGRRKEGKEKPSNEATARLGRRGS
jgi:hypothetical protein